MADIQTVETDASVDAFVDAVEHPRRREDARALVALFERATRTAPRMWGPAIIGYGKCRYRYDSGREGDMPRVAFSPRKQNLVFYLEKGDWFDEALGRLGKHKLGVGCLYVNKLADVDLAVLEEMIVRSWAASLAKYPAERDG
jgi:hypothetical protein